VLERVCAEPSAELREDSCTDPAGESGVTVLTDTIAVATDASASESEPPDATAIRAPLESGSENVAVEVDDNWRAERLESDSGSCESAGGGSCPPLVSPGASAPTFSSATASDSLKASSSDGSFWDPSVSPESLSSVVDTCEPPEPLKDVSAPASSVDPSVESEEESPDEPVDVSDPEPDESDEDDADDPEPASDVSANAICGAFATATPTPNANANAPTRPIYRAYPIVVTFQTRPPKLGTRHRCGTSSPR
jgi:hypothetical protein